MSVATTDVKSVDEYIASQPEACSVVLKRVQKMKMTAPKRR